MVQRPRGLLRVRVTLIIPTMRVLCLFARTQLAPLFRSRLRVHDERARLFVLRIELHQFCGSQNVYNTVSTYTDAQTVVISNHERNCKHFWMQSRSNILHIVKKRLITCICLLALLLSSLCAYSFSNLRTSRPQADHPKRIRKTPSVCAA